MLLQQCHPNSAGSLVIATPKLGETAKVYRYRMMQLDGLTVDYSVLRMKCLTFIIFGVTLVISSLEMWKMKLMRNKGKHLPLYSLWLLTRRLE